MFERYTEKARRVIFFGRYEASQFGSSYIETEHLLLGILREDKALANRLLRPLGAMDAIRTEIAKHSTTGKKVSTSVDLPVSNECKRVLSYAAEEAQALNHKDIAVEHLLLGLLREEKCFAAELLHRHGVQLSSAREKILHASSGLSGAPTTTTGGYAVTLADFGRSLTQQASDGVLPPLVGRERELERVIQVLCRLTCNSPVLVGEPGIGKKSIVNGLAHRIANGNIPASLENSSLTSLDMAVIASGTRSRVRFEENLEHILSQIMAGDGFLFFVNGLHSFAETQHFLSIVNVLKPALLSGSILCITTATRTEYAKTIQAAPWLEQVFTVVEVRPPTEKEAVTVLRGIKKRFEEFHGVIYTDEALQYAVFHASSYFPNRHLPEKAVDLIDEAAVLVKLRVKLPNQVIEVQKRIKFIQYRHDNAIGNHEFEKARFYSDELRKEQENLKSLKEEYKIDESKQVTVTREHIEHIIGERTGIAMEALRKSHASENPHGQDSK